MELFDKVKPKYYIDKEMNDILQDINEKLKYIDISDNQKRKYLISKSKIRSIHSSLAIEANSLSLFDVENISENKLVLGRKDEVQEVKNAIEVYNRMNEYNYKSESDLLKVHSLMMRYFDDDNGEYRNHGEGVKRNNEIIYMAPSSILVPSLMKSLFAYIANSDLNIIVLAAIFHYYFVSIHPFSDGNGRMARLWHTALLTEWKPVFAYIPLESQIEKFQEAYYQSIAECHVSGKSNAFIEFMLEQTDQILENIVGRMSDGEENLTEYVKHLLEIMEYDVPYTGTALMNKLGLKSKEAFRKNYMKPAMELGLIQMTIPDKPKSRNQRYIKV